MLLAVIAAVVALIGGGGAAALAIKRRHAATNQVVPGVASGAPVAWAGAHSPEAKLHRRLRDAVSALRANAALDDAGLLDARGSLERHAVEVDERLVAVAALPGATRDEPLARVAEAVDAFEQAVASLALDAPGARTAAGMEAALAEARERIAALAAAHAELDAGEAGSAGTAAPSA